MCPDPNDLVTMSDTAEKHLCTTQTQKRDGSFSRVPSPGGDNKRERTELAEDSRLAYTNGGPIRPISPSLERESRECEDN
jgi:hypothetical protein